MKDMEFIDRIQKYVDSIDEINKQALEKIKHTPVIGDQFHYLTNYIDGSVFYISPSIQKVLGYQPFEFNYLNDFYTIIHPEDLDRVKEVARKAISAGDGKFDASFVNQTFHVSYRIQKKDGKYIKVLRQTLKVLNSPEGDLLVALGIITNITHLKSNNKVDLLVTGDPIIGYDSRIDEYQADLFSKREKDIIRFLIQHKTSKQIAEELNISFNTVDTHRRKILKKANSRNTAELLTWLIKNDIAQE